MTSISGIDSFYRDRLITLTCKNLKDNLVRVALHSDAKGFEEGMSAIDNLFARYQSALTYQAAPGEEQEVQKLYLHRKTMFGYGRLFEKVFYKRIMDDCVVQTIQLHLDKLENPESNEIIFDKSGRSMFCMPGGTSCHLITYEFAREVDGSYSFLIYNKGDGLDYAPFHGTQKLIKREAQAQRTRVQIKGLTLRALKNPNFLKILIQGDRDSCCEIDKMYELIYRHLILQENGYVRAPYAEAILTLFPDDLTGEQKKKLQDSLLDDPDYHRIQVWGSCGESNVQTPERFIISPVLRKKMKLREIEQAVKAVGESYLQSNPLLHAQVLGKSQSLRRQIYALSFE